MEQTPKLVMENPEVKNLLSSNATFDLVIQELLVCEALLGFGHFYKAPTIFLNSVGGVFPVSSMVGNSQPYSYVPTGHLALSDEMTFMERVVNSVAFLVESVVHIRFIYRKGERTLHEYFPEAPPLEDLVRNVSLVLLNAHYSVVETPRPYVPKMIAIGGFHVQPQTLPSDLQMFLDDANDGAILVSFGTNSRSADLPQDKIAAMVATFAKLPQRFLWKYEGGDFNLSDNVKVSRWFPQRAILSKFKKISSPSSYFPVCFKVIRT